MAPSVHRAAAGGLQANIAKATLQVNAHAAGPDMDYV